MKRNIYVQTASVQISKHLQELLKHRIIRIEEVDFTGDGKTDYICYTGYAEDNKSHEYWITDKYEIVKERAYDYEVSEVRFVNIDTDPEPEIINVFGDGEHISYVLLDQKLKQKQDDTLFFFIPVVLSNHSYYSAYIGGITDMFVRRVRNREPMINCVFEHNIVKKYTSLLAQKQSSLPLLLFSGNGIEPLNIQQIGAFKWYTLSQIKKQLKIKK